MIMEVKSGSRASRFPEFSLNQCRCLNQSAPRCDRGAKKTRNFYSDEHVGGTRVMGRDRFGFLYSDGLKKTRLRPLIMTLTLTIFEET